MDYHEAFWVTLGTVAPVIALTCIISITDAFRTMTRSDDPVVLPTSDVETWKRLHNREGRLISLLFWSAAVNLILQGIALADALESLAHSKDSTSPEFFARVEPGAFALLFLSAVLTILLRMSTRRTEEFLKRPKARNLPAQCRLLSFTWESSFLLSDSIDWSRMALWSPLGSRFGLECFANAMSIDRLLESPLSIQVLTHFSRDFPAKVEYLFIWKADSPPTAISHFIKAFKVFIQFRYCTPHIARCH